MRKIWYTRIVNVFLIVLWLLLKNTFITLRVSCSRFTGLSGGINRNLTGFVPIRFRVGSLVDRVVLRNVFHKVLSFRRRFFPSVLRKHSLSHSSSHHRRCLILVVITSFNNTWKTDERIPNIPTLYTFLDFSCNKNDKFPGDLTVAFLIVRSRLYRLIPS